MKIHVERSPLVRRHRSPVLPNRTRVTARTFPGLATAVASMALVETTIDVEDESDEDETVAESAEPAEQAEKAE